MTVILTAFLAFVASAALTHLYIRTVHGRGPVALPNHRSMHKGEVAVGGGLPLLASAFVLTGAFWKLGPGELSIIATAAGLAAISFLDDIQPIPVVARFAAHIAAAAVVLVTVPISALVLGGTLPFWLDRAVVFLALVWFINLFNFMDGIDGIAGVETAAIAGGYAIVSAITGGPAPLFGLSLALAGASLGFLFWNWHPARVFMGDVGSVPIGLLCGALMIALAVHHSLTAALILPMYFVADATITLLRRIMKGERVWQAHRQHAYQRAARALGSHAMIVRRVAVCNGVLVGLAVLSLSQPLLAFILAIATVGVLIGWMEAVAARGADAAS